MESIIVEVPTKTSSIQRNVNPIIAAMIRRSRRSWWRAFYANGKVLNEWDTLTSKVLLPIRNGSSSRWEIVPKDNMIGLHLLCPNGLAGALEATEGHKFFQLKIGGVGVGFGGAKGGHYCDAHIIGLVRDADGNSICRAWEYQEQRLIDFEDNVFNMQYRQIGRLSLEVQGLRL